MASGELFKSGLGGIPKFDRTWPDIAFTNRSSDSILVISHRSTKHCSEPTLQEACPLAAGASVGDLCTGTPLPVISS